MLRSMFDSTTIPVLQETLRFSQARHGVLATNTANMGVPGYRVRDLSVETFQERMKKALEMRHESREPVSPGVLTHEPGDPMQQVRESLNSILYHDESNVGLEQQANESLKNQFLHNLSISVMSAQFRILQAAVTERV